MFLSGSACSYQAVSRDMISIYRCALLFLLGTLVLLHFFPWGQHAESEHQIYLGLSGAGAWLRRDALSLISNLIFLFYLASYLGMLFFKKWARSLLLFVAILGGFAIPVYGLSIQSGLESSLGFFATLGDGFVIAVSYFSPVNKKFDGH